MSDENHNEAGIAEVDLDLDGQTPDLEAAMKEAVAAVESVESAAEAEERSASSPGAAGAGELERLRREVAEYRDRSVRTLADFDNFRKRNEREREELLKYALLKPIREFLGVADNLDLALQADGSAEDLKRGVEMIRRQLQDLLRRFGVSEVAAVGQPFDPAVHEAVAREESPEASGPTVVAELRRGYRLHDRLLRPAMVKVAVPLEGGGPPPPDGEEGPAL
jgi:molecular chaperone GrpE